MRTSLRRAAVLAGTAALLGLGTATAPAAVASTAPATTAAVPPGGAVTNGQYNYFQGFAVGTGASARGVARGIAYAEMQAFGTFNGYWCTEIGTTYEEVLGGGAVVATLEAYCY